MCKKPITGGSGCAICNDGFYRNGTECVVCSAHCATCNGTGCCVCDHSGSTRQESGSCRLRHSNCLQCEQGRRLHDNDSRRGRHTHKQPVVSWSSGLRLMKGHARRVMSPTGRGARGATVRRAGRGRQALLERTGHESHAMSNAVHVGVATTDNLTRTRWHMGSARQTVRRATALCAGSTLLALLPLSQVCMEQSSLS